MHDEAFPTAGIAQKRAGVFLNVLIQQLEREDRRQLAGRLKRMEGEEACLHRAVFVVAILHLVSVAGLLYCALLSPEVFDGSARWVGQCLSVLALGSLISIGMFLGYLFWHRVGVNRLHQECRQVILELVQKRTVELVSPSLAEGIPEPTEALDDDVRQVSQPAFSNLKPNGDASCPR